MLRKSSSGKLYQSSTFCVSHLLSGNFFLIYRLPGLLKMYFRSFQSTLQFLHQIYVKNNLSNAQCKDLNSELLHHESILP